MADFLIQNIETGVIYHVLDQAIPGPAYSITDYDDIGFQTKSGNGFYYEIFSEIFLFPILFLVLFYSFITFLPEFFEPWFGFLDDDSKLFMYKAAGAFSTMAVIGIFCMKF